MSRYNAGLGRGVFAAMVMLIIYLFDTFVLAPARPTAGSYAAGFLVELAIWVLECFIFYGAARSAAEAQYQHDAAENPSEPYARVTPAAETATLIPWVVGWVFAVVRAVIADANGYVVLVEPFSLACAIVITGVIAIAVGVLVGSRLIQHYQDLTQNYVTND